MASGFVKKKKREQSSAPVSSLDVLQALFVDEKSAFSNQFKRWKLWAQWGEIVGSSIADVTEPLGLYEKRLVIWVSNSSWLHHLSYLKNEIIKKLNLELGADEITEIQFTLTKRSDVQKHDPEITQAISKLLKKK